MIICILNFKMSNVKDFILIIFIFARFTVIINLYSLDSEFYYHCTKYTVEKLNKSFLYKKLSLQKRTNDENFEQFYENFICFCNLYDPLRLHCR